MNECVLVVDDDRQIVRAIRLLLQKEGMQVLTAYDGLQALQLLTDNPVQLVVLDVMMPKMDGLSALMHIRQRKNLPVIVLSAKTEETDKVLGLSMGADDYVAKPFNPQELVARIKSQLRRYTQLGDINATHVAGEIVNGRLRYRLQDRTLLVDGEPVHLTAIESGIIDLLMRNCGRIFPAEEIYGRVWEEPSFSPDNTVMVHIRHIREKIELDPGEPEYLKVVWGIGYKMEKM